MVLLQPGLLVTVRILCHPHMSGWVVGYVTSVCVCGLKSAKHFAVNTSNDFLTHLPPPPQILTVIFLQALSVITFFLSFFLSYFYCFEVTLWGGEDVKIQLLSNVLLTSLFDNVQMLPVFSFPSVWAALVSKQSKFVCLYHFILFFYVLGLDSTRAGRWSPRLSWGDSVRLTGR